jgi:probable phosphoglycerate mutase
MATTVYWIRHGEAEGNLYRRCHGHYNSLITPNGRAQLAALSERFKDVPLDAFLRGAQELRDKTMH